MNSPHAWVTHAIGEYLVVVWLTTALAALLATLALPWAVRVCRLLVADPKAPGDSPSRDGRPVI